MTDKEKKVVGKIAAIAGAGVAFGPLGAVVAAVGMEAVEKNNLRKKYGKYEGTTQRECYSKKEVPSEIRREWNEKKQKKR